MSDPAGDLRSYTKTKQSLADLLQQLLAATRIDGEDQDESKRCRALLAKLAEESFTIAVVGQFNRGKSTLLNALLGRAILPTGVLPVTSVITSITYGAAERLIIRRKAARLPAVVPLDRIADYVTEAGNPGNREEIEEAIVETALPLARRGVSFVDTPGIASAQEANTVTTYGFLPKVDAAIFVTSVESPMSGPEADLLRETLQFAQKLFIVINKFDLIEGSDPDERKRLTVWVKEQVKRISGEEPDVYPVSSLRALEGEGTAGTDGDTSGLSALLHDLERFLAEKGELAFLSSVYTKAVRLASEVDARQRLSARIIQMQKEGAQRALEQLAGRFEEAEQEVEAALTDLRNRLFSHVTTIENSMVSMTPVWHWFLAGTAGNLEQEFAASPGAQLSQEIWQDRLLAALAEEQTTWLAETLRKMRPYLSVEVRSPIERIAEAVAGLDREAAETLSPDDDAANGADSERIDLPNFTVLRVSPVALNIHPSLARELGPLALRRKLIRRSLRKRFGEIIDASHERVIASCKGTLSIVADTIAQDARRSIRRRRRVFSEPLESGSSASASGPVSLTADILRQMETLKGSFSQSKPRPDALPPLLAWTTTRAAAASLPQGTVGARCAVCAAETSAQFALFAQWQYLLSRDGRFREAFVREGGFCPLHTWQFEQMASPQTLSYGFAPLLESIVMKLDHAASRNLIEITPALESLVHSTRTCAVCAFLRREEEKAIQGHLADMKMPHRKQSLETSFGLCLPHFIAAVRYTNDESSRKLLLAHQISRLEETADNMRSYAVKRESLRRELIRDGEGDAWNAALRRIVGERNMSMSVQLDTLL